MADQEKPGSHLDPTTSGIFRWAWTNANMLRSKWWLGGVAFGIAGIVAGFAIPRTWGSAPQVSLIAFGIAAVAVFIASLLYALILAAYQQRNALRNLLARDGSNGDPQSKVPEGSIVQRAQAGNGATIVQAGRDLHQAPSAEQIGDAEQSTSEGSIRQSLRAGERSVLVQAGRDVTLAITKSPPDIKLVRIEIEDDDTQRGVRQKINIIAKNNGDTTAFMTSGSLVVTGHVVVVNCNNIDARYSLSQSDWEYDIDIDSPTAGFTGQHSIAPNEVVNFDIMVGRSRGGHELSIYRAFLRLQFDEGNSLETAAFHLKISGPTIVLGAFIPGSTEDRWGRCMADNIRRLDQIGYDLRPTIDRDSAQYIEAVAPGLLHSTGERRGGSGDQ